LTPDDGEPEPPDEVSTGEADDSAEHVPESDVPESDVPAPQGSVPEEDRPATDQPDLTPSADGVPAVLPPEAILSRAELQKAKRKSDKKERKRRHRWRRRILYTLAFIVLLAAAGAGGLYEYANYRFGQIKKIHAKHLIAQKAAPGAPFNLLLVGSDSRAFVGDNSTLSSEVGNEANAGGQRSDVTMVARFDPAKQTVTVLSIPRDLWVDIPGHVAGISGMNRINAAYNSGPDLLIQTIEQDLGIPINHYVAVDFPGFSGMVNALGGITMDFPTAVKDAYTGLYVTQVGCQVVNGTTALQLVRARHLYYMGPDDEWEYDGESDFSRIQRQDAFFRAVLQKINVSITNPLAINSFIGAAVGNLTIDDTLTQGDIFHIAEDFRGLPSSHLITETLPTLGYVTDGGADVLDEAQPYAQNMINAFNAIGAPPPTTTTTTPGPGKNTTTTAPLVPHDQITVNVLNASTVNDIAHTTATALSVQGFYVGQIGDSTTQLTGGSSEILYGPDGYAAAQTVGAVLNGPVTYEADSSLSGQTISLLIAGSDLTVTTGSTGAGPTTTTTTTTTSPTPTTIPSDVYTNTEAEPWNP
jgi:LCP family protein required for cell wall assembly